MKITVQKANWKTVKSDALAFFQVEDKSWIASKQEYYGKGSPLFNASNTLLTSGDMTGKKDEAITLYPVKGEAIAKRVILIGLGKREKVTIETVRRSAARMAKKVQDFKAKSVAIYLPSVEGKTDADVAGAITEGVLLGLYKFDKFFKKDPTKTKLESVTILTDDGEFPTSTVAEVKKAIAEMEIICNATNFARDMENEPSNNKYPEVLANWAKQMGKKSGVKVTALGPKEILKNNIIGTYTVNKGSEREARFIVLEYNGAKKKSDRPYVLVGKGITFDTGGISIKPAAGMGDMKSDMSGAATVIATLRAAADLKLPVNLIGLVASAENMPSGSAMRPGDIITYPNGVSAEIDNTDAEGRLVLADALIWAQRYNPKSVIDLATLTGACVVALGHVTTAMMGNDEHMKQRLSHFGNETYERVCELPIYEEYEDLIKSDVADVKNVGGRWAGSITAALFLKKFTDYPWIHLDYIPKGGTGVGVRLLTQMLKAESA
jgi:leucyl aminopeptidase